ncbi:glycosyltransferase [Nakamurella aerolata]|uniref:Glycosyltransferase n=1 Tax=Nakamurella aerolata TaxID=1656892 RepID=A0A849A7T7_9ACTN|nr:glycosyltransferase [Nakamurella aerolata]NNG35168.1 glycosyltransferase [Nakamurella aerolata]
MRILHVSQPVEAGVPQVVVDLVADEVSEGHQVHLACPADGTLGTRAAALGARVHRWEAVRDPGRSVLSEARALRRIAESVDPDVIVLHSAKAGLAGRLRRLTRRRVPVVYVPHAWSFEAGTGALAAAAGQWEILAGRRTDVIVCVSADERVRGEQLGIGARMQVITNGIDLQRRQPADRSAARRELGLADAPTVVCVGRLAEQKGQDLLLQLWPQVRRQVPDAQLLVVGDGPDRESLQRMVSDGVTLVGASDAVDRYYAAADVVALPSRWESTSLVAAEAMAAARPVVAFEVDGVSVLLGDTGRVIPAGDSAAFADALVQLLTDPTAAAAAGRAARHRAEQRTDLRTSQRAWRDLLRSLVSGADRPVAGPVPAVPADGSPAELRTVRLTKPVSQLAGGALTGADLVQVPQRRRLAAGLLSALGYPVQLTSEPDGSAPRSVRSEPPRSNQPPRAIGGPVLPPIHDPTAGAVAASIAAARPGVGVPGTAEREQPLSVVVTVLNEGDATATLVEDLAPQLLPGDELIIVDGGSTDGSLQQLRQLRADVPQLQVLEHPGAGISQGRNIGIAAAGNEFVVCTDVGCVPVPGFLAAYRRAFALPEPPALVSGVYRVTARNAMELAQALACYPQPSEVRRRSLLVRGYTAVFGTGFDPRFAVGRCVGFTKTAWRQVGGFPEHLATGEDVSFGLAIAEHGDCLGAVDGEVAWQQRDGVAATWRMYRGYGRASTDGGDRALLVRDGARALAYLATPALLASRRGRWMAAAGAAGYLSLPVVRALRVGAGPAAIGLLPVAMAVKDLGKVAGALQGEWRRRRRATGTAAGSGDASEDGRPGAEEAK